MSISQEPQRPKYQKKKRKKRKTRDEWTITDWKEHLWKVFSKYIRLRDCIKTTKTTTEGRCVTCGKIFPISKLQAGHFIPGRMDSILFDEDCVHTQCYRCNCILNTWPEYYRWMQSVYGQEVIEQMIDRRLEKVEITIGWVQNAYEYYEKRIEELYATV